MRIDILLTLKVTKANKKYSGKHLYAMRVIRGVYWLASNPQHISIFLKLQYIHIVCHKCTRIKRNPSEHTHTDTHAHINTSTHTHTKIQTQTVWGWHKHTFASYACPICLGGSQTQDVLTASSASRSCPT